MEDVEANIRGSDATAPTNPPGPSVRLCTAVILTILSSILLTLFLYSAIVQHNDNGGVFVWMIFYYWNALLSFLAIAFFWGMFKSSTEKVKQVFYILVAGLFIWGSILAVRSGVLWKNASASDAGGDAATFSDKEEKLFEFAGALLGVGSATYHGLALKYGSSC